MADVTLDDSRFPVIIATVHDFTPEFVLEYKAWLLANLARAETEDTKVVVFDDALLAGNLPPADARRVMLQEMPEMLNQPRHYGSVILQPSIMLQLFVNSIAWMVGGFYRVKFAQNYEAGFTLLNRMALKAGIANPNIPDHATYVRPTDP